MLRPRRSDILALLRLAIPVVVVQVGLMFMGTVDTLIVGRVSPQALAAVAVGNLYSVAGIWFANGILMAVDPIVSQGLGAGDLPAVVRGIQRALVIAAVLAVLISLQHLVAGPVLALLRQPAEVVPLAATYNRWLIPGILPFLAFGVFRLSLQSMHRLRPVVVTIVLANIANAVLNWTFVFGHLGAPALGVAGSAIATSTSRWLLVLLLGVFAARDLVPFVRPWHADAFDGSALVSLVSRGLPIALQYELEIACFGGVALLAGAMGTSQVAGHQIAINLAALTYMVPLGVSAAAAVLVGRAVGAGDTELVRRQATSALLVGAGFMLATGLGFLALPGFLARLYTTDAGVLAVAGALIPLAGVFQVFDGIQVVSIGVLRGVADTRTPFLVNLLGYWAIGMPVGILLGYPLHMGVVGLWWGLVVGLGIVAVVLLLRVRGRLRSPEKWRVGL